MRNLRLPLLLAALAVAFAQAQASAQVVVQTPGVRVVVSGNPVLLPAPVVMPAQRVIVEPTAPPAPVVVGKAQSIADFACSFQPAPTGGRYEVVLQHPCTCCPVKVCFCLPPGCPRKVRAFKNSVEIRYGLCKAVVLRFLPDGSVRVRD